MDPRDYLHLQLRLEGKDVLHDDQLRQVEVVPGEEMPLMIVTQLADKRILAYYDEAIQPELHVELAKRIKDIRFPEINSILEFLKTQIISFQVGHYKTYLFPEHIENSVQEDVSCLSKQESLVQEFGFGDFAENVFVIERDGKVVSACVSTRENQFGGEAWVHTDPEYRGRGLAQKVVSSWAGSLIRTNKVPFYSHDIGNISSAKLAKRLKLQPVFEEIVFTQPVASSC